MTVPSRRRTQQERREHTETALVAAAAEVVVESGVRALTLARVGERAGYSRGIVTHHFGSKQGLVDALARSIQGGFVPGLDAMDPGLGRLLALVDGYLHAVTALGTANRAFLLLWAEAATTPELADTFRDRDRGFRADLRVDVEAGIAAGDVRSDADPDAVAVAVVGQLRGIGMQRLVDPEGVDTERLRHDVTDQWRRALRAG
ncbi:TetR/AcrR family transcriptional regulator [Actinomycetospora lutea]|uniref:TetR/AcrR family transcriptional regulator n=1 Tax=Actinomycetospora lutea TaxID=663604 RepID=UPI002365CF09|nr:TetR/AcrR family transcriptional regulator [Actinomycetospora lutea]MDD7938415.1 TetR/AcrR family transcriptional regulator [Actinomycetospora lutea]